MSRLKNITSSAIALQMFNTDNPQVNSVDVPTILSLTPGEDVSEQAWLVSNVNDLSHNQSIIDNYIKQGILTRLQGA